HIVGAGERRAQVVEIGEGAALHDAVPGNQRTLGIRVLSPELDQDGLRNDVHRMIYRFGILRKPLADGLLRPASLERDAGVGQESPVSPPPWCRYSGQRRGRPFDGRPMRIGYALASSGASVSTIRSAALPSQTCGRRPVLPCPASTASAAATILAGSTPTIVFVPSSTVTGRSVFSRSVTQGMPSAVV